MSAGMTSPGPADGGGPAEAEFMTMLSMITGYWVSQIVRSAVDLSIAEHLEKGPLTAAEIAARESADPAATFRLLRACVSLGLLSYSDGRFSGTALLRTLNPRSPFPLKHSALALTAPGHWLTMGRTCDAVRQGRAQAEAALGADIFSYFGTQEEEGALFSAAMTEVSTPVIAEAAHVIDTTGVGVTVDVGGANGAFVLALMARNPDMRGVVVELPHVVAGARAEADRRGLGDRFSGVAGDFFESLPGGDLYLLKCILHDWDDDSCVKVLERCRTAMNPGARIVVVEMVIGETGEPGFGPVMDIAMLTLVSGRERRLHEFDDLFVAAGLKRTKVTRVLGSYGVIEAVAA